MTPNQRVRLIRQNLGLSQVDFSRALRITQSYLSELERGVDKRNVPLKVSEEVRKRLWDTFNVNISWLMTGGDNSEMFNSTKTESMYQQVQYTNDKTVLDLTQKLEACTTERDRLKTEVEFLKNVVMNLSKGKDE